MVFVFLPPCGGEPEGTCNISIANTKTMSSKKWIKIIITLLFLSALVALYFTTDIFNFGTNLFNFQTAEAGWYNTVSYQTPTRVQTVSQECWNLTLCTITISPTVAGNTLIVGTFDMENDSDTPTCPTMAATGAIFQTAYCFPNFDTHRAMNLQYAENVPAGITSVNVTYPATTGEGVVVVSEYSGLATSNSLDAVPAVTDNLSGSSSYTSTAVTPTSGQNELMIGLEINNQIGETFTGTNGWTSRANLRSDWTMALSDKIVAGTSGSYTNSGILSVGTGLYVWGPATFKAARANTWTERKAITINRGKVPSTQTDFPVLIDITDASLAAKAQADGDDILFTSGDGSTKIPHEIEVYTTATGRLTAWVKVPSLSSTADTVIYMYYGNSAASSQQDATNVWDTNYKGVWHLPNGSSLSGAESTSNPNAATASGATAAAGEIDGGANLDGNDLVSIADDASLESHIGASGKMTISLWVKQPTRAATDQVLVSKYETSAGAYREYWFPVNNGVLYLYATDPDGGTGDIQGHSTSLLPENQWTYVTLTYDNTLSGVTNKIKFFFNGNQDTTIQDEDDSYVGMQDTAAGVCFSCSNITVPGEYFTGIMDEMRISSVVRSNDWIKTEYNNQSATSTFYTLSGSQNSAPTQTKVRGSNAWYSSNWLYRKPIIINKGKVPNSNQTDFPVLIDLTDANLASGAQTDGDDILFTAGDGVTRAPHEIEIYTSATGRLTAWVKAPLLSTTQDTTLYMYYGNAATSSEQVPTQVWDTNYKAVWHVADNAASTAVTESTSNPNAGTFDNNTSNRSVAAGKIGRALDFVPNEGITVAHDASLNLTTGATWQLWIKRDTISSFMELIAKSDNSTEWVYELYLMDTNKLQSYTDANGNTVQTASTITDTAGWHLLTSTFNTTNGFNLYIDGNLDISYPLKTTTLTTSAHSLYIGEIVDSLTNFDGKMDEVRISSTARSADWVKTEYNNQSATSTFYTIGSQQTNRTTSVPSNVKIRGGSSGGGSGSVAYTVLNSGTAAYSGSDVSSASISPTGNRLLLAIVVSRFDGAPGDNIWSVAGDGLTWVRVEEVQFASNRSVGVFRAMGTSPSSGAVTFTEGGSAAPVGTVAYSIIEFSGIDTSGTNGSGAVGTPAIGSTDFATSLGITITGTPATGDITFATFGTEDDTSGLTSDALWGTIETVGPSSDVLLRNDYDTGQDLSPTWTWTNDKSAGIIGFIIKVGAAAGTSGSVKFR